MKRNVIPVLLLLTSLLNYQSIDPVGSIKEVIDAYLQLKNALAKDNSSAAAESGNILEAALNNFEMKGLSSDQKKLVEDVDEDATEHAEHIGKSKGNIVHQREHFELLSNDLYDLVKVFGPGRILYRYFCPVYENGKGAYWLSETKEIQNPYSGKSGPQCGVIKEELK